MRHGIAIPFELHRFKLSTPLGTVRRVAGKMPLWFHFFRHGAELIEVHTRKAQQHATTHVVLNVEFYPRKVKQSDANGYEQI